MAGDRGRRGGGAAVDSNGSQLGAAREFVTLGVHHILNGYDHLLFVLAHLLVPRTFGELVRHGVYRGA